MNLLGLMAGIGMSFNSNDFAERTHVSVVPPGWYVMQIVDSKIVPTKTPGGARLNLQFKILQGDFAGRMVFQGYNVKNANPVAVNIAMEELAELSKAVGVPVWEDTEQLHGIPFNMKVKCKAEAGYDVRNEPQIYQHIQNMDNVVYATKADIGLIPKAVPAAPTGGGAFGGGVAKPAQPATAFGQQPAMPTGANAFGQQQAPVQQQPVQQPQQQIQQQQARPAGAVNFTQAAQQQPWNGEQQPQQQPQQQQPIQQPVQQPQQPVQQPAQVAQQPNWAHQQVQPGTEQPQQPQQPQQPVNEQPDEIAQAAQSTTPPWKRNVE